MTWGSGYELEQVNYRFSHFFFFLPSLISLIADGPHHYHPACGHKGSSHLSPVHALQFVLSRCKFSILTTCQPMVEFYLLTFPRFPLRKKEHKSYFGKNRTHDFRTSRCAGYLLDVSGDECIHHIITILNHILTPPCLIRFEREGMCRNYRGNIANKINMLGCITFAKRYGVVVGVPF